MIVDPNLFKLVLGKNAAEKLVRSLAFVPEIAEDRKLREVEVKGVLVESGHYLFKQGEKPSPVFTIKALSIYGRTYETRPGVISDVPTFVYLRFGENTFDHVFSSMEVMAQYEAMAAQ